MRLGLVGCGQLAERGYVPALSVVRGLRLVAVADPVRSRCRHLAPGVPAYDGASALVGAGGVDALVLATPASAHLEDGRLASEAGLPALVEKPPAPDLIQALALANLKPPPWIGFNRRFEPGLLEMRAALTRVGSVDLTLDLHYRKDSWRSHVVVEDALLRLGPHLIDLARWLTGSEIMRLRASHLTRHRAQLELELERGRARISCATDRPRRDRIEARDGNGRMIARHSDGGIIGRALRHATAGTAPNPLVRLLVRELEDFAMAVRGEAVTSLATAADGIPVMAAIEAARCSAEQAGSWRALETHLDEPSRR